MAHTHKHRYRMVPPSSGACLRHACEQLDPWSSSPSSCEGCRINIGGRQPCLNGCSSEVADAARKLWVALISAGCDKEISDCVHPMLSGTFEVTKKRGSTHRTMACESTAPASAMYQ